LRLRPNESSDATAAASRARAILEAIDGIETSARGKTLEDLGAGWLLRHGIQRGVEIVSEAARRIPPELQATRPEIPGEQVMGIGNVLRHEYHRISDTVIWNVVKVYLPPLQAAVLAIEQDLGEA
jgi:uncharacterized protein with HEPN domain